MEDKVVFKDKCSFEQLDEIIDQYNIAVGGLGYHRRGAKYDTSIKNKEYCAWGIPFICACKDLSFDSNFKYLYKVSANEEIIDIEKIVNWYMYIYNCDYREEMYQYAKEHLNFEKEYYRLFKE